MRHTLVTRLVLLLAALLAAACVLFAWRTGGRPAPAAPPGASAGEAVFARHCAACHVADDLLPGLRSAPDAAAARDALLLRLATHGDTDDAQDRVLADWLAARASAGGAAR